VFDAYGKPPTGILMGNLHFIGSYDECMALNEVDYDRYTPDGTATPFCFSSSCVRCVASFSVLSFFDCPFDILSCLSG
jgi:hypothetical protein